MQEKLVLAVEYMSNIPCRSGQRTSYEIICLPAGPSAEVDFWRQRAAMLMGLGEQLNLPRIRMMVDAVELGSSDQNLLSSFRTQHQDIKWVGSSTPICGQDFRAMHL